MANDTNNYLNSGAARNPAGRLKIVRDMTSLQLAILAMTVRPDGWFGDGVYEEGLIELGKRMDKEARADAFPGQLESRDAEAFTEMEEALKRARNAWSKGDAGAMGALAEELKTLAEAARHPHLTAFTGAAERCHREGFYFPREAMRAAAKVRDSQCLDDQATLGDAMNQAVEIVRLFVADCLFNERLDDSAAFRLVEVFMRWVNNVLGWDDTIHTNTPAQQLMADACEDRTFRANVKEERNVRS